MFSDPITKKLTEHFPNVQIKFKDTSMFMKFLGIILFFTPNFMTTYTTTIGETIYFPSEAWLNARPASALIILLHELIHVTDAKKISKPLFGFLYLFPLPLIPIAILLFLVSWKIALPLLLLSASPVPAYFRMLFEKRAYFCSLYTEYQLNTKHGFNIDLVEQETFFLQQFTGPAYYFMWPFSNLKTEFADAVAKIKAGQRPYDNSAFDIIDDILTAA